MSESADDRLRRALARLDELEPTHDLVARARARLAAEVPARPRTKLWLLVPAMGVALGIALFFWGRVAPRPSVADVRLPPALVVFDVRGEAWVGDGDARVRLRPGERVPVRAALATADNATATFIDATASVVILSGGTRASWDVGENDATQVELQRGVLRVEAKQASVPLVLSMVGSDDRVRVETGSVGVVAGAGGGSFAVLEGEATLERRGGLQTVHRGHEVVARYGASDVVTTELHLTLAPVGAVAATARTITVTGQTRPGVLLTIDGRDIAVDGDGHFSADIVVSSATHRIVVIARDALDRSRRAVLAVRRNLDKRPRERQTETHWEWERTPG